MAKFKVGDKVAFKGNKSYKGVVQKVQPLFGHETIYTIKWNDGKQYDVTEGDLVLANSVRSTNSVVVKALNSVGYNPSDKQDWSIHSVTAHGTWIKKRVHDMTLREAIAEAKKDASKYKYEKVTIYDTVTGKSRHEEKIANSKVAKNASLRKIYSAVKQATQSDMSKAQQMAKSVLAQVKTAVVDLKKVEQSLSVAATSRDNDAIADALIDAYDTIEGMIY